MNVIDTIDISLDIETLATDPRAVVTEIGLAATVNDEIDPSQRSVSILHVFPDINEQLKLGREIDGETVVWRLMHSPKFESTPVMDPLQKACARIVNWLSFMEQKVLVLPARRRLRLWSKGPEFDLTILRSLMKDAGCHLPIHYAASRCVRTIEQLYPDAAASVVKPYNAHDALADAVYQLNVVQACLAAHESRHCRTVNTISTDPDDQISFPYAHFPDSEFGRWNEESEMDTVSIEPPAEGVPDPTPAPEG